jgi:hypothetical protein
MKKLNIILEDQLVTPRPDPVPRGRQKQFPVSVILVCCAAMFLWPTASLAQPQFNIGTNNGVRFLGGSFSYAYAYVYDSYAGYGRGENNVGPVSYPGGIGTAAYDVTGWYYAPHAQASVSTYFSPILGGMATQYIFNHYPGTGPQAPPPGTMGRDRSGSCYRSGSCKLQRHSWRTDDDFVHSRREPRG